MSSSNDRAITERSARIRLSIADPADLLFIAAAAIWLIQAVYMIGHVDSWLDEGLYLIKSGEYFSGRVQPYSLEDATAYPPLYFYVLGAAQWLFGHGHLAGRLLSVFLSLCTLILLRKSAHRCLRDRPAAALAVLIYAANPMVVAYMSTATPYAIITLLTLASFLVVTETKPLHPLLQATSMGVLAAALVLIRLNLAATLPMFAAVHLLVSGQAKKRALATLGGAALVAGACLVVSIMIFGHGLFETLSFLPGLAQILWRFTDVGTEMQDVLTLTRSPNDLQFSWSVVREVANRFFLQLYPALLLPAIPGGALSLVHFRRLPLAGFCTLYFVVMTLVHLLGSQSYCPPCLMAYANYFLPFAAIPAALCLVTIGARIPASAGRTGLILFILATDYYAASRSRLGMLISDWWSNPLANVQTLAQSLKPLLPDGRVLVLSGKYQPVQAVWLAGRFIEPYSVSLFPNLREPLDGLDPETKAKARHALQMRGFRDATALIEDLKRPAAAVVLQEVPPLGDMLAVYLGKPNAEQVENTLRERYSKVGDASEGNVTVSVWLPK
ncbi:glycosyltransferase family 39 protein [Bradyrhizobium sp. NBAIM03]|uniref:glycosyltransferase family 39 protein n=1 Tax=Bradyrhizobium sp. NBAIM03 TaxID=2793816 RepID=UPI001CD69D28|nr:glycosyltransferase family 39 protein [Bradyrhizobium sp. NBAIM03]MCA1532187.1 glycosyltransferase family 39 protein [Bradyrhizobium sp. NBAIM03]